MHYTPAGKQDTPITVTVKEQLALFPAGSVAVYVTTSVPIGKGWAGLRMGVTWTTTWEMKHSAYLLYFISQTQI